MSFWQKDPIVRNYISDLDRFLMKFDKKEEATSTSRQKEEIEYQKIFWLRDHPAKIEQKYSIWDEF